jgi:hypothetical protein
MFAPILVFGYNRPVHLQKALLAIEANPESKHSDVYIFLDGPKPGAKNSEKYEACKLVAQQSYSFKSKTIKISPKNLGLANSIKSGIDYVFEFSDRVIVIEDDIILSSSALSFLNQGLTKYATNPIISSLSSYQYPISQHFDSCVGLRGADCWGWATWIDRWKSVNFDSGSLLAQIESKGLIYDFDLDGAMDYSSMLGLQTQGKIDSWAICWHGSMFLEGKLCLYPPESLSRNIGSDGTGTHSGTHDLFETNLSERSHWSFPNSPTESSSFRNSLIQFYRQRMPEPSLLRKLGRKAKGKIHFLRK